MAAIVQFFLNTAKTAMSVLNSTPPLSVPESESSPPFQHPSPKDVLLVKTVMLKKLRLPLEIVDTIIDWAEYWPCTTVTTRGETSARGGLENREDELILRSLPLGYYADADDDPLALPIENFLATQLEPRFINESSIFRATTEDLLRKWQAKSLPRFEHPCRKIVFTIKSRDQGWASQDARYHSTYQRSWTWFDVGLEQIEARQVAIDSPRRSISCVHDQQLHLGSINHTSQETRSLVCGIRTIQPPIVPNLSNPSKSIFEHPLLPTGKRLQSNLMAERKAKEHIITWAHDDCIEPYSQEGDALEEAGRGRETATGDFVRNLKLGDIVTIWARARFPGWVNHVEEARIDIYWVV